MHNDVIVIGAGCAGMVAASSARLQGADVLIITRGPLGVGSNTALANGNFTFPTSGYTAERYIQDTVAAGKGLNDTLLVEKAARNAAEAFQLLCALNLEVKMSPRGCVVRAPRSDILPGAALARALAERVHSLGIRVHPLWYVTNLTYREDEGCWMVCGFNHTGDEFAICAGAVVLASGGAGGVYLRNDNQRGMMGQGYYLAAQASLALRDTEFVQFYPLVIAEPGLASFVVYPPYPEEARVINQDGDEILGPRTGYDLNEQMKTRRDEASAMLIREGLKGPLFMDYRAVPDIAWRSHPLAILTKMKFDVRRNPFAIAPAAHFFMGGVQIDSIGSTRLPGLYACGEVTSGFHGANRMNGNGLTECLVFGDLAGRHAAVHSRGHRLPSRSPVVATRVVSRSSPPRSVWRSLRQEVRRIAWERGGVLRHGQGMDQGLREVAHLRDELNRLEPLSVRERIAHEDVKSAMFVVEAVLRAGRARLESRGAFIREDCPDQDDTRWRKHSSLTFDEDNGLFSVTQYPPGE